MATIADRVQQLMIARGWTRGGKPNVKDMERKATLPYATAHALVRGTSKAPDRETLEKAAKALRTSVAWLEGTEAGFDLRAYEMGRADVVRAVEQALRDALEAEPTAGEPEGKDVRKKRRARGDKTSRGGRRGKPEGGQKRKRA